MSCAQNIYRRIFWITAADKALTIDSFRRIAIELGILGVGEAIDDDRVIKRVKQFLEDCQERWLLIFDNYDSPTQFDDLQDFFPDGKA